MTTQWRVILVLAAVIGFFYWHIGCRKKPVNELHYVQQIVPDGFPKPVETFVDNPLTQEGIELGRKLFYDGRLSRDGNFPCASCHQQIGAFGTYEHDRSHGYNDSHTLRNAPPLINLIWQPYMHWDGEFKTLYSEARQPITGILEMAETYDNIITKLQKDPLYPSLFLTTFGSKFITPTAIQKALAQFTGSIISYQSKYDRIKKNLDVYNPQEAAGYILFKAKCATCHPEPLFTDYVFRNNGLRLDTTLKDSGLVRITRLQADALKFKTPSLRNISLTANYMHDGRFNTLLQVLNHYRSGIQQTSTLDPALKQGISLTDGDAFNLIQFLKTLNDSTILKNKAYSKP